jgi:hypothetical protein
MATNGGTGDRTLMVHVTPLVEWLRRAGVRAALAAVRTAVLKQVTGRFPRVLALLGIAAGQRQAVASGRRGPLTDVELVPPPTSKEVDLESMRSMLETLSNDPDWNRRARAALALSAANDETAIGALLAALADSSAEVAVAAISALAQRPGARVTAELTRVLRNADDFFNPMTRAAAMRALTLRAEGIDVTLWASVVNAIDAELSMAAIAIIAERCPEHLLALVLPVLEESSGYYLPMVRLAAAGALESAGLLAAKVAERLLHDERDETVRAILQRSARADAADAA